MAGGEGQGPGFSWEAIGDIDDGRPNLGLQAPVAICRLRQFSLRHAIVEAHGAAEASRLLEAAGSTAGGEFDEGFIAGIFREYSGPDFTTCEVDCWSSGERVRRFAVTPPGDADGA